MVTRHWTLWAAGLISVGLYLWLALPHGNYADLTLWPWLTVTAVAQTLVFLVFLHARQTHRPLSLPVILGFAILFRIVAVFGYPILEDDHFRYLWDGYQWVEFGSPYRYAPADFFATEALASQVTDRFDEILTAINYPDVSTVYAPVSQWAFAIGYRIAPGEVWPLQLIMAMADMALILLLSRTAAPSMVLLYAWCPLVIKEFAFTAHPDVLAVLLVALAVHWRRHALLAALCLGLAINAKIFALLAVPFVLGWRWLAWLCLLMVTVLATYPFGPAAIFNDGLSTMATLWVYNAPLTLALLAFLPISVVPMVTGLLFLAVWGWLVFHQQWPQRPVLLQRLPNAFTPAPSAEAVLPAWPPLAIVYGVFLLCAPVANAWYWVWVLAFATHLRHSWPWIGAAVLPLAYVSGINLVDSGLRLYQQPTWSLAVQAGLIAVAVLADRLRLRTQPH